jgi:hypothetical protein
MHFLHNFLFTYYKYKAASAARQHGRGCAQYMDIIAITPTQQLLWILLALLLAWMITFTWLAMKRTPETTVERKEKAYYQASPAKAVATHIEAAKQAQTVVAKHEAEIYLEQSVR